MRLYIRNSPPRGVEGRHSSSRPSRKSIFEEQSILKSVLYVCTGMYPDWHQTRQDKNTQYAICRRDSTSGFGFNYARRGL